MVGDNNRVVPRGPNPCRQRRYGGHPRDHMKLDTFSKHSQPFIKLFCPAVKSGVSGKQHRETFIRSVGVDIVRDDRTAIFVQNRFFSPRKVKHPAGADHVIRIRERCRCLLCHAALSTGTDADERNLYPRLQRKPFCQKRFTSHDRNTGLFARSADDDSRTADGFTGKQLFGKAAGLSGILGYQIGNVISAEQRFVQFRWKRSLHGDQMFSLKTDGRAMLYGLRRRKHPREDPFLPVIDRCIGLQLLAACGREDPARAAV